MSWTAYSCLFIMVYRKNQLKGIMLNRTETPKYYLKPLQPWLGFKCRSNLWLQRSNIPSSETCLLHTRFPGVKIPFRFWSLDGAHLECRQKYFNTNNRKGNASIQFLFHIEIPCTNCVFTMVKLGQICHFWKVLKPCFFLRPAQSHLNGLFKVNCWIIK